MVVQEFRVQRAWQVYLPNQVLSAMLSCCTVHVCDPLVVSIRRVPRTGSSAPEARQYEAVTGTSAAQQGVRGHGRPQWVAKH